MEDWGLGWCKGLGFNCEGKIINVLLLMLSFLLVGGIVGLRLHLSTAPGSLCYSSEPEDNPRWRSIRMLGSLAAGISVKAVISRRYIPTERGEQAVPAAEGMGCD